MKPDQWIKQSVENTYVKIVWMNPVWDLTGGFGITKTDFFHPNVSQLSISASPALLTKEEQACKHCPIYFQAFPSPVIGKIRTSFQWETWANFWKKNSLRNAFDFSRRCQWAANYNRFKQLFAINFHREKIVKNYPKMYLSTKFILIMLQIFGLATSQRYTYVSQNNVKIGKFIKKIIFLKLWDNVPR